MKVRKKPVEVEAIQLRKDNIADVAMFITCMKIVDPKTCKIIIPTLEGDMAASENDWVIKGVNGEFYPCKPDIFEKTYDIV